MVAQEDQAVAQHLPPQGVRLHRRRPAGQGRDPAVDQRKARPAAPPGNAATSTADPQPSTTPPDTRLIERWLPIAEIGEESIRERRSMTALPPTYYLHVWWARRPLVASRAAILASLLPADADHEQFLHAIGIHGDPVAAKARITAADRRGERLGS